MGRPRLPVGTFGKIKTSRDGDGWRARASFRDYSGALRDVSRWEKTEASAERALKVALTEMSTAGKSGEVRPETRFKSLAEVWLADVETGRLAHNTQEVYRAAIKSQLVPALGELSLREIDVVAVNRVLKAIQTKHGPGAAKTARSVLSSTLGSAVAQGAIPLNPVRDAKRIEQPRKEKPRALTWDESLILLEKLRADETADDFDVPDMVEWMMGTGTRIGETCAVRESVLDAKAGTVEINATMIRIAGQGLHIQQWTKSDPGWRVLALPPNLTKVLADRKANPKRRRGPDGVVFCSPLAHYRDPSNTAGSIRAALNRAGFEWVVPHTFRKSVATWMDEAGMSARTIADQLGHARPSLTQDVYMGRKVVSAEAAAVLSRNAPDGSQQTPKE